MPEVIEATYFSMHLWWGFFTFPQPSDLLPVYEELTGWSLTAHFSSIINILEF